VGEARKRGATEEATQKVTNNRAPAGEPWTLPEDYTLEVNGEKVPLCPYLVELLGIDGEQAARTAHRWEDSGVWHDLPPAAALMDLPPEYRSAIETLMDAEAALHNVEDAVTAYRQRYDSTRLRREPLRPTHLRDQLTDLNPAIGKVLGAMRHGEPARLILGARRAGVDTHRLRLDLEKLLEVGRKQRECAAAASSKAKQADRPLRVLIWHLAWTFKRFSKATNRIDRARARESFIKAALEAAGIDCPGDLPRWLPPRVHPHSVARNASHEM
jgi:hypothetical protein